MEILIQISETIDCSSLYEELKHPQSGGICVFIGAVRNHSQGQEVEALFFEAYETMAKSEMKKIAETAGQKWDLQKVVLKHAIGTKNPTEPVVAVGASSAHREACFEACRFLIDRLKKQVPIWKKEFFKDKSVWVTPHP